MLVPLLIGAGTVGSTTLGTAALSAGDHNMQVLSEQTYGDISNLHSPISFLQNQVDMLAEMVLQNCHGLDLLFFREGGLCMALGETCCFYAMLSGNNGKRKSPH